VNPQNSVFQLYMANLSEDTGDVLRRVDPDAAQQCWRDCVSMAEPIWKLGQRSGLVLLVRCNRRLAEAAGQRGDRRQALAYATQAMNVLEAAPQSGSRAVTAARAYGAMGLAYAGLSKSTAADPADRERAREWLEKTVASWHSAETDPGFASTHRKEMKEAEAALAALGAK